MNYSRLKSLLVTILILPMLCLGQEHQENHPVGVRKPVNEPVKKEEVDSSFSFTGETYPVMYFPDGMHSVVSASAFGDVVVIEDGSFFTISPYDRSKVSKFRSQDPILITQNHAWFSSYKYRIINQSTGSILEANLSIGPKVGGIYTRYIVSIDRYRGELNLNDSTRWKVSDYDFHRFYGWEVGDPVIIGYNTGWDKSCSGIIINVSMDQHIRVAPL